jgi:DNA-binding LacI/PurR family transcriptional regulator
MHLVALGHRNIAFIAGTPNLRSAERRLAVFRRAKQQLFPDAEERIYYGNFKIEGGRCAASEILASGNLPTAVLAANDLMALGAINEFRAAGLHVPRDISVIGFDDIAFAALADPPLTTVNLPRNELGRRAVEALLETLADSNQQGVEITIPTQLIIRASTAPARASKEANRQS